MQLNYTYMHIHNMYNTTKSGVRHRKRRILSHKDACVIFLRSLAEKNETARKKSRTRTANRAGSREVKKYRTELFAVMC